LPKPPQYAQARELFYLIEAKTLLFHIDNFPKAIILIVTCITLHAPLPNSHSSAMVRELFI
jgi:hypothetical protein